MKAFAAVVLAAAAVSSVEVERDGITAREAWCSENADCRANGDSAARCVSNACVCSTNYGARWVGDVSVELCYPATKRMVIGVQLNGIGKPTCAARADVFDAAGKTTKDAVHAYITSYTQGNITHAAFTCTAGNFEATYQVLVPVTNKVFLEKSTFPFPHGQTITTPPKQAITLETPHKEKLGETIVLTQSPFGDCTFTCATCLATWLKLTRESDQNQDMLVTKAEVEYGLIHHNGASLTSASNQSPLTMAKYDLNLDGFITQREYFFVESNPAAKVSLAFDADNNALELTHHDTTDSCEVAQCSFGYFKSPKASVAPPFVYECIKVVTTGMTVTPDQGTCTYDGDCSWKEGLTHCVAGTCVAPPQKKAVRQLTPYFELNWCDDDTQCKANGDAGARCDLDSALGNWCNCTEPAYAHPVAGVPVCTTTTNRKFTVSLGFKLSIPTASLPTRVCPLNPAEELSVKTLLAKVLGDTTAVTEFCSHGLVTFMGKAEVALSLAHLLATSTAADTLDKRFRAEMDWFEPANQRARLAANTPSRAAQPLHETVLLPNPYAALRLAYPSASSVGPVLGCQQPFANVTAILPETGHCHALSCSEGYAVVKVRNIHTCRLVDTPMPAQADDSDDDLSKHAIAIIVICSVLGLILLVVLVLFLTAKPKEPEPVGDEDAEELDEKEEV